MHTIKLAVFDMAGTSVNEDNLVYKTVQRMLNESGFDLSLEQVLKYGAGKEKKQAITDILYACTDLQDVETTAGEIFSKFQAALKTAYATADIAPTQGMESLFRQLRDRGIKIVLNTGYDRETAMNLVNKLNWQIGVDVDGLVTASDVTNGRPFPDMIQKAMRIAGVDSAAQVLKVGDSAIDIEEGKNAGCGLTVGVLGGAQTKSQIAVAAPDYIVANMAELGELLFSETEKNMK